MLRAQDRLHVLDMFQSLSLETRRSRFFGVQKYISEDMLVSEDHLESGKVISLVAEHREGGAVEIVGDCRLYLDDAGHAGEFSIVIRDPWQRMGLGGVLTQRMVDFARARGTRKVYAYVLIDNVVMLRIFAKHEVTKKFRDDHFFLEKSL